MATTGVFAVDIVDLATSRINIYDSMTATPLFDFSLSFSQFQSKKGKLGKMAKRRGLRKIYTLYAIFSIKLTKKMCVALTPSLEKGRFFLFFSGSLSLSLTFIEIRPGQVGKVVPGVAFEARSTLKQNFCPETDRLKVEN